MSNQLMDYCQVNFEEGEGFRKIIELTWVGEVWKKVSSQPWGCGLELIVKKLLKN